VNNSGMGAHWRDGLKAGPHEVLLLPAHIHRASYRQCISSQFICYRMCIPKQSKQLTVTEGECVDCCIWSRVLIPVLEEQHISWIQHQVVNRVINGVGLIRNTRQHLCEETTNTSSERISCLNLGHLWYNTKAQFLLIHSWSYCISYKQFQNEKRAQTFITNRSHLWWTHCWTYNGLY
jgi:hypothetical protein